MGRVIAWLWGISLVFSIVVVATPPALAEKVCPAGSIKKVVLGTGEIICVARERSDEGVSTDPDLYRWRKPGLPDDSTVRKKSNLPSNKDEWTWDEAMYYKQTQDPCWGINDPGRYLECQTTPWVNSEENSNDEPPSVIPEEAAQQVIAKLRFTAATPQAGPNRDHHDFPFDTAVGYPVWLWTNAGTTSDSVTESVGPITVSISISLDKVVWDMGDGTTLRCDKGTKWRHGIAPGKKSPTCGHVYKTPGKYTIEATSHWVITWDAGGQTGSVPYSITADRPFEVGEIHVLVR